MILTLIIAIVSTPMDMRLVLVHVVQLAQNVGDIPYVIYITTIFLKGLQLDLDLTTIIPSICLHRYLASLYHFKNMGLCLITVYNYITHFGYWNCIGSSCVCNCGKRTSYEEMFWFSDLQIVIENRFFILVELCTEWYQHISTTNEINNYKEFVASGETGTLNFNIFKSGNGPLNWPWIYYQATIEPPIWWLISRQRENPRDSRVEGFFHRPVCVRHLPPQGRPSC